MKEFSKTLAAGSNLYIWDGYRDTEELYLLIKSMYKTRAEYYEIDLMDELDYFIRAKTPN